MPTVTSGFLQWANNAAANAAGQSAVQTAAFSNAMQVAVAFAQLSAKSAEAANAARLRAARRNIEAGTAQIADKESDEKRKIAQALARHQGTLRVNSAYRGTGSFQSTEASAVSSTIAAGREAANITANAAAQVQRLYSDNNPQLEDPRLAAIQGGLQGFATGQQLSSSLISLGTQYVTPPSGWSQVNSPYWGSGLGAIPPSPGGTYFSIPGIDLGQIFNQGV